MSDTITLSLDELQRIKCMCEVKGMTRFAFDNNGVQTVGNRGHRLTRAIQDVAAEYRVTLPLITQEMIEAQGAEMDAMCETDR